MGKIWWRLLAIILLWLPACLCVKYDIVKYDIKEIGSLVQAQAELDKADQQTLVVFDVDETLINPTDTALQLLWQPDAFAKEDIQFMVRLKAKLQNCLVAKYGPGAGEIMRKIWSQQLLKSSYVPVEPNTIKVVKKLQKRGIKVIALTGVRPGLRGDIVSLQQWRFNELKKLDIDLSEAFAFKEMWLDELPCNEGYHPMYFHGILLATYTNSKGKVLDAFLNHCGWRPQKILFFDDRKDYVEGVVHAMRARGIECRGYWYCASMRQKPKLKHDIVQIQFDYLMHHGRVISEQEAIALMHKSASKTG